MAGRLLASLPLPAETQVTALSAAPEPAWLVTPPLGTREAIYPWLADLSREEERAARCTAEEAAVPLRERGVAVTVCVRRQRPAEAILQQAEADRTDLIVLGCRGTGAMEPLLIGGVSERVARYAPCSVLVARGEALQRALVAIDGSESSEEAIAALLRLPLSAHAEISVVHIAPTEASGWAGDSYGEDPQMRVEQYYRALHRDDGDQCVRHAVERLQTVGRVVTTELRCGIPGEELITAAREWQADLLVVGAENLRHGVPAHPVLGRRFLGSVSSRVLSHAPCSVLVGRISDYPARP
jgi:nucleotide-binding universal stress UspA family protein